jgi:hypothetical protein
MAFPGSIQLVTVTGAFFTGSGPRSGTVHFEVEEPLTNTTDRYVVPPGDTPAILGTTAQVWNQGENQVVGTAVTPGAFSVVLIPTDATQLSSSDWLYLVTFDFNGGRPYQLRYEIPYGTGTQDISLLTPVAI